MELSENGENYETGLYQSQKSYKNSFKKFLKVVLFFYDSSYPKDARKS